MYFRSICLFEAGARRSEIGWQTFLLKWGSCGLMSVAYKSQVDEQYKESATWQCCLFTCSILGEGEHLLSTTCPALLKTCLIWKPAWSLHWKVICPSLKTGFSLVTTHDIIGKFFMIRSSLAPLVTWPITACLLPSTSSRCSIFFTTELTFKEQESFGIGVQWCGASYHREVVQYRELLLLQKFFLFILWEHWPSTPKICTISQKKLDLSIFEPPYHHNLDGSDIVTQAVSRKVVVFKESWKDMVLIKFKLPVEADVIQIGNILGWDNQARPEWGW